MYEMEEKVCKERANGLSVSEQQIFASQFPTAVLWNEIENRIRRYQDLEDELQALRKKFL